MWHTCESFQHFSCAPDKWIKQLLYQFCPHDGSVLMWLRGRLWSFLGLVGNVSSFLIVCVCVSVSVSVPVFDESFLLVVKRQLSQHIYTSTERLLHASLRHIIKDLLLVMLQELLLFVNTKLLKGAVGISGERNLLLVGHEWWLRGIVCVSQ